MNLEEKTNLLQQSLVGQFIARTEVEGRKRNMDFGIVLDTEIKHNSLWFTFTKDGESHSFNIPVPFMDNNVLLIEVNEVHRAVCPYLMRSEDMILDYFSVMQRILCDNPKGIIPDAMVKRAPFIQQIVYSFDNNNTSVIMYNLQRAINEVVNRMPLHETYLNSWVMNRRLIIIDPEFDSLRSPEDRLGYQVQKSRDYFDRGWTSMGLADGTLADKNYILTCDIRHLTPFGMKYHNPGRNLYSTLGMKGVELPKIRSQSMQNLMDTGVTRYGWNWFTLFADIPDVFENQIMVDISHRDKYINYTKRVQCFGVVRVKEGQKIHKWQTLSISDAGTAKKFDVDCDWAKVEKVRESEMNVGGVPTTVFNVIIKYRRYLRDGVKITNLHGNKGVIRMKDLGYMVDPKTGDLQKIDVITSAKSVKKRKNYGQILEALLNNTMPEESKPLVLPDDYQVDINFVKQVLVANGLPNDGTRAGESYIGPVEGVSGDVFWGVIASVENALWDGGDTIRRNTRDLRVAGLKFSHVEFRALQTRFGKENPILDEVLTYAQGAGDLVEYFKVIRSKMGEIPNEGPANVYTFNQLNYVNQDTGTIIDEKYIEGTIVDEQFEPEGFYVRLPVTYETLLDQYGNVEYEGAARQSVESQGNLKRYLTDMIYVPKANMRRCWRHDNGKLGLNEISVLVNNILIMSWRYVCDPENAVHIRMLYRAIAVYFNKIAGILGTKRGEIAQLGMSVRYPFSAKAVATLSNRLPANTIEIHESMAKTLRIKNGDVVLVERFPCLGFMSVRPQKVKVARDEMAKYTIRVSGNCLCSLGLDFDGDVIYLASFHTPEAVQLLHEEWEKPNSTCYEVICRLNEKAGCPQVSYLGLDDYDMNPFSDITIDEHAVYIGQATGVKSHTGPVIALAYNIMRILENSAVCDNQEVNVAIEVFLDRVGNTVFKQKHGVESLHAITMNAICLADVEVLAKHGFDRATSQMICDIIRAKAKEIGVSDLVKYYNDAKKSGWSNIINRIVREQNKIYFASRANLEGCKLLEYLGSDAVDIPSQIFKSIIEGRIGIERTKLEEFLDQDALDKLCDENTREACETLLDLIDKIFEPEHEKEIGEEALSDIRESFNFFYRSDKHKYYDPKKEMIKGFNKIWRQKCQVSSSGIK